MARDKNTYAKRQRESLKRQKGEAKRERRRKRKEQSNDPANPGGAGVSPVLPPSTEETPAPHDVD